MDGIKPYNVEFIIQVYQMTTDKLADRMMDIVEKAFNEDFEDGECLSPLTVAILEVKEQALKAFSATDKGLPF